MKLRLPNKLVAALMTAMSAAVTTTLGTATFGSSALGEVTYDDLTRAFIDEDNHVYYDGHGTFELNTTKTSTIGITINVNALENFQGSNDYTGLTPFVTWTVARVGQSSFNVGFADVSTTNNKAEYAGLTGYYNNGQWSLSSESATCLTLDTLKTYADASGNVAMTLKNTLASNSGVQIILGSGDSEVIYKNGGLAFTVNNGSTTAIALNRNYITSVTLYDTSDLDVSGMVLPPDYSGQFRSDRWDAHDETSLGRVLFAGDSITHGVADMSWRWQFFKTMTDNGIESEIAGPREGYFSAPTTSDAQGAGVNSTTATYGGETFVNAHLAQASGRTHNIISGANALSGVTYDGWSTSKTAEYYNADTIICMMGTNDILSDNYNETFGTLTDKFARMLGGTVTYNADNETNNGYTWTHTGEAGTWGQWGTMGTLAADLMKQDGDTLYIMSVPTWGNRPGLTFGPEGNADEATCHLGAQAYNVMLEQWTRSYSAETGKNVKYVDVNRGLVDVTNAIPFKAYSEFFLPASNDQLHPKEQGSIIIAANLAKGMGLAGRTAGLHRADSSTQGTVWTALEAEYALNAGDSINLAEGAFSSNGGYTVDFKGVFSDGNDAWLNKSNALSVAVGDGAHVGTLSLSEGYISWGDKVLFCQDNTVQGNDTLRIAYHTGDSEANVGSGYYVWLGDMLIGQALSATNGSLNGITLSAVGAQGAVSGLIYSDRAYAPTSTGKTSAENAFYATLNITKDDHDNAHIVTSGVNWTASTVGRGNGQYATTAAQTDADGNKTYVTTQTTALTSWVGGLGSGDFANSLNLKLAEGSLGSKGAFGAVNAGTVGGDVTLEFDSAAATILSFTDGGTGGSIVGGYKASIDGTFTAIVNKGTVSSNVIGGFHTANAGNHIGAVELGINGGSIGGSVYGGSIAANGTVGTEGMEGNAIAITVTGGTIEGGIIGSGTAGTVKGDIAITLTGGIIKGSIEAVNAGATMAEGATSSVTVQGNLVSIGGANISADTVKLKDVAQTEYSDGIDHYKGTITATDFVLDNYTANAVKANLVTDYVTAANGTHTTIRNLTLRNCAIDADETSALTLGGEIHSGNTISYSGNLYLEDGIRFTIDTPTDITVGDEGFSNGKYIYKVADEGTGHLYAVDGTALTYAHTSTFTGTDGLAGMRFAYDAATGALIAHTADATYKIATSTVNYSDIASAGSITMSGGQLNLDTALVNDATINATGGVIHVGEGVALSSSSLTGATTPAIVNEGGTITLTNATQAATLLKTITGDSGTIKLADGLDVTINGAAGLHSQFHGVLDIGSATLKLGNGWGDAAGNEPQFDSFSAIRINGGTLRLMGWGCDSHQSQLVVDGTSTLKVQQHNGHDGYGFNVDGVQLSGGNLNLISGEKHGQVVFAGLSGSHTLYANGSTEADVVLKLKVNDMSDFTGNVVAAPTRNGSDVTLELYTGNGDVEMGNISASNHSTVNLFSSTGHSFTVNDITVTGSNAAVNVGSASIATHVTMNGTLSGTVNVLAGSALTLGDTFNGTAATSIVAGAGFVDVHVDGGLSDKHLSLGDNGYVSGTADLSAYKDKVTFNNQGWMINGEAVGTTSNGVSFDSSTYQLTVTQGSYFQVNTTVAASDVTAPAAGGSAILVGNGTLTTTSWTLNNISVADGAWTGTVSVTNSGKQGNMQNSIANLANANSKVELKGVNGWFGGNVERNIVLTGTGSNGTGTALTINDGHSGGYTRTFTRAVEGHGDIEFAWNNGFNHTVEFSGDISRWDGYFKTSGTGSGDIGLKFSGDASEIKAGVTHNRTQALTVTFATTEAAAVTGAISKGSNGGALKLVANNDVTFKNTVTASSLTVAAGHTATFNTAATLQDATQTVAGTIRVNDTTLSIASTQTSNTTQSYNRMELNGSDASHVATFYDRSHGDGNNRNITTLAVGGYAKLQQESWCTYWNIDKLTDIDASAPGTLTWLMDCNHNKTSIMKLNGEGDFSGTLVVDRGNKTVGEGRNYQAFLQLNHELALQNATVNLQGNGNTRWVAMALNTAAVTLGGLEGNANGIIYAGEAATTPLSAAPTSTSTSVLTLNTSAAHTYNGLIASGIDIVKTGSGAQTLSNLTGFTGDITVNAGTLNVTGTLGSADTDLTVNGGTLHLGDNAHTIGSLTINDGGTAISNRSGQAVAFTTGEVDINAGGTLKLTAHDALGWSNTPTAAINMEGTADKHATMAVSDKQTFCTTLNLNGYADVINGEGDSSNKGLEIFRSANNTPLGTINVTGVGNTISTGLFLRNQGTITTAADAELTISGDIGVTGVGSYSSAGSFIKEGSGTLFLSSTNNTYSGATIINDGALIATNSSAVSSASEIQFGDLTPEQSAHRVLAFAQGATYDSATGNLTGKLIDGTIAGLSGNRGTVMADTLTINLASGEKQFLNRYDSDYMVDGQTVDNAVLQVNKLVKTGAGTQVIGGEYTQARGFSAAGLVIANGVDVQQGTLHLKTRGVVTSNFDVRAGATLKTTDDGTNQVTASAAVKYDGTVTLHGTEANTATMNYADGSTYITEALAVDGYGKLFLTWGKLQYVKAFTGSNATLTVERNDGDADRGGYVNILSDGSYSGTINLITRAGDEMGGLIMHDAAGALANTVLNFGTTNDKSLVAFITGDGTFNGNRVLTTNTFTNGTVAGLVGEKGSVKAATLTINTAAATNYDFGGTMNITNLVKDGAGTQTLSGTVTYTGTTTVNAGELIFAGGSAELGQIIMKGATRGTDVVSQVRFSAKDDTPATYTFTTLVLSSDGNTGKKWFVVDKDVTVRATGNNVGSNNSTVINGWGLNGGGLEINGTFETASFISMDGPDADGIGSGSNIIGTGKIKTTGLNISNGAKTTIDGGLTIEITSANGIFKRAGSASSLKLGQVTLQSVDSDWTVKAGSNEINTVELIDTTHGTTFEAADNRTITVAKAMGGTGKLIKTGAGVLALNGANTYTGGTTVSKGTVKMGHDSALGSGGVTVEDNGTLDINGHAVSNAVSLAGTITNTGSSLYAEANGLSNVTLTDDAVITGTNGISVKDATIAMGEHTLSVTNGEGLYFNNTTVTGGGTISADGENTKVVFYGAANAGSTEFELGDTAHLYLRTSSEIGGLSGSGTVHMDDGAADNATLTINAGKDYTSGATLVNNTPDNKSINIAKTGAGTQNFSGNVNSFNGTIEVNNGTLAFTGLSAKDATENINNLHVGTATVNDNGSLKAGLATLTAKEAPMARSVSKTGTVSDAVFAANSLKGVKDETHNGGTLEGGLLEIAEAATYTISDMTLTNSKISAAETHLEMSNINVDAASSVVAMNESTLAGNNRLTLIAGNTTKDITADGTISSNQLKGLTLNGNLTIDLSEHDYAYGVSDKSQFSIVLSGFTWQDLIDAPDGSYDAATYKVDKGKTLDDVFKVIAVGGNADVLHVLSVSNFESGIKIEVQVPEPTTSVLSLLALAGLAARRRRK